MPERFDPAQHAALHELARQLPTWSGSSYASGQQIFRSGAVQQRTVTPNLAAASVQGSGANAYRVTLVFAEVADKPKPGCTCPAFRRNPFCKHVVALALAVIGEPATFTVTDAPPEIVAPPARARRGAGAKAPDQRALRASGLESVDRLLASLAESGLRGLGPDKLALLGTAAELVKGLKLRRLGNLIQALQDAARGQTLDERGFATLLCELYALRRAAGAALDGRASLEPALAEELIGKTWQEKDLEMVGDRQFVEVAYTFQEEHGFRVWTSYLVDLGDGALYAERQITPRALRSARPKPSYLLRLEVKQAGLYPGRSPRRVKLIEMDQSPLRPADLARVMETAESSVPALRARLVAHHALPFSLGDLVVLVAPSTLTQQGEQVCAVDRAGHRLRLSGSVALWRSALGAVRTDAPFALCGALAAEGARLTLDTYSLLTTAPRCGFDPVLNLPEARP